MVSLPAVTSCTKKLPKSMSLIGWPPKSASRISDVRSSRGCLGRGGRRRSSIAYIAMSIGRVRVLAAVVGDDVGVLAAGVALGQLVDAVQSSAGRPMSSPMTWVGRRGDLVHELDVALFARRRP